MPRGWAGLAMLVWALCWPVPGLGKEAAPAAEDPVLEARMVRITGELRCLVCQNQTIADSHAGLAIDLRNQMREMIKRGDTDAQIIDYMTARYGDFVLYRPPLQANTGLLWFGPAAMLLAGAGILVLILRRRSRMPAGAFEPEEETIDEIATDAMSKP